MPEVRSIEVRYYREKQPVQYEKAGAEMKVAVNFTEQEYNAGAAARTLLEAKLTVLGSLGLQGEIDAALQQAGAQRPDTPSNTLGAPTPVPPKKAKGTTKDGAKVETPADPAAMSDEAPKGSGEATAGEAAASATKTVTDEDLQKAAAAASGRVGSAVVKEEMKKAGIARLGELAQEKRLAFVTLLEGLKKTA